MYSGKGWRDIGHARMFDPYAEYEDESSPQFVKALATESAHLQNALKPLQAEKRRMEKLFSVQMDAALPPKMSNAQEIALWHGFTLHIQHVEGHRLTVWMVEGTKVVHVLEDLTGFGFDPDSRLYFTIIDIGSGDQTLELAVYTAAATAVTPLYKISPVGPNAGFQGEFLYFESITNQLRSSGIVCVNKHTGRGRHCVYLEKDFRRNVELMCPPRQADCFFRTTDALSQRLAIVNDTHFSWITPAALQNGKGVTLLPVLKDIYATNKGLVHNGALKPFPNNTFIQSVAPANANSLLVSTVKNGVAYVYLYKMNIQIFEPLFEGKEPCNVMLHTFSTLPSYTLTTYYKSNAVYEVQDSIPVEVKTLPEPVKLQYHSWGFAPVKGAKIPYTYVSFTPKPSKLIVSAYGAYGISAQRAYPKRWLPWLLKGYAFVEAMPRGGRENGDAWYDAARGAVRKVNTFLDTAAVIKTVQRRYRFSPAQTIVYGRSAGGWTAAYIGLAHASLVGAVYAEVPYLDVLRTTTNPDLPLTQLEYNEFGDPRSRREEYVALQKLSPVDIVPPVSPNAPFFLVRSAVHDTQVYPYEALKFGARLRSMGWNACVAIDETGGHFVKRSSAANVFATDFVLLDSHLKRSKTRRRSRYARTHTRRR